MLWWPIRRVLYGYITVTLLSFAGSAQFEPEERFESARITCVDVSG